MAQGFSFKQGRIETAKNLRLVNGAWLEPTGSVMVMEDFLGPLATASYVTITQSGTPSSAAALSSSAGGPTAGHGGWLAGSVDNVDNEIDEVALGGVAGWLEAGEAGTGTIVCEFGFVVPSALTAQIAFAGFSDALTGGANDDGPISITTGTTLVSGVTGDGVGFVRSSLATDADGYYMGAVKATTPGTAVNSGLTAVVDDYTRLRVEVDVDGNCYFFGGISASGSRKDTPLDHVGTQAAAVTVATGLNPIYTTASTTTAAVPWEIDYMFGAGPG